jgi:hypothetical protein
MFTFSTSGDDYFIQSYGKEMGYALVNALKEDRASLYSADLLRSGFFILVAFGTLWFYIKGRLAQNTAVVIVGVFMIGDLFFIDKNYVSNNPKQFKSEREVNEPFQPNQADDFILKDTTIYRVYEVQGRLQGRTSYFHKSVGGYSAVRPRRYNQLFDYEIDQKLSDLGKNIDPKTMTLIKEIPMLNALNIKYLIVQTQDGESVPILNPMTNGNAWFVKSIQFVNSADEEMKSISKFDSKNVAIINEDEFGKLVKNSKVTFEKDSLASIKLDNFKPNVVRYTSNNTNDGLAVFSEVYYPKGWKATIDGKAADIFRVNYVLRGLKIPAGKHSIEFKFEPEVVKTGGTIALFSSVGMMVLIIVGLYFERKKKWYATNDK